MLSIVLLTHELFKSARRNQDRWINHSTQVEEESSTTCSSAAKLLLELLKRMASVVHRTYERSSAVLLQHKLSTTDIVDHPWNPVDLSVLAYTTKSSRLYRP